MAEYPEDLQEEFRRLSELIGRLRSLYLHRVRIDLISAQSFLGMYKAVRHHIKEYPAFIVDGKDVCIGWDWEKLVNAIDRHIGDNN